MVCAALGCDSPEGPDGYDGYQCGRDDECEYAVNTGVAELLRPAANSPVFDVATCQPVSIPDPADPNKVSAAQVGGDVGCNCTASDGGATLVVFGGSSGCLVYSRSRSCLYASTDFAGCDPKQPDTSCRDVCDDLTMFSSEDASRTFDAKVRSNRCLDHECAFVVEIDGSCYANRSKQPYDCGLSDDEILRRERAQ